MTLTAAQTTIDRKETESMQRKVGIKVGRENLNQLKTKSVDH